MKKKMRLKRLRRIAERATVGRPNVAYQTFSDGARRLSATCTRGFYKLLKRSAGQ